MSTTRRADAARLRTSVRDSRVEVARHHRLVHDGQRVRGRRATRGAHEGGRRDGVAPYDLDALAALARVTEPGDRRLESLQPVGLAWPDAGMEPSRIVGARGVERPLVDPDSDLRPAAAPTTSTGPPAAFVQTCGSASAVRFSPALHPTSTSNTGRAPSEQPAIAAGQSQARAARGVVRLDAAKAECRPEPGARRVEGAAHGGLGDRRPHPAPRHEARRAAGATARRRSRPSAGPRRAGGAARRTRETRGSATRAAWTRAPRGRAPGPR